MPLLRNIAGFLTPELREGKNYPIDGDSGASDTGGGMQPMPPVLYPVDPIAGGDTAITSEVPPPANILPVPGAGSGTDWMAALVLAGIVAVLIMPADRSGISKTLLLAGGLGGLVLLLNNKKPPLVN